MKEDLRLAYEYFSHHIRTSSSTIVATLEAVKDGLADNADDMLALVTESGFLLDIFDRGMCAAMSLASPEKEVDAVEEIDVVRLTRHFFDHTRISREGLADVDIASTGPVRFSVNGYLFKVMYQVLLWEAARCARKSLHVSVHGDGVALESGDGFADLPKAMDLIIRMLASTGVSVDMQPSRWRVTFP